MTASVSHGSDVFAGAEHNARVWLDTVAHQLGTRDRHYAYRVLRAWLCTIRDRLTPDAAAHFAAQLPALLRGVFFDGWRPSQVPAKYDAEQFFITVAQDARLSADEAKQAIPAVTAALALRCSPGQLDHLFAQLPGQLRDLLAPATTPNQSVAEAKPGHDERIEHLEHATQAALDALRSLVEGLEELPTEEPQPHRITAAAHHAHQILLEASREAARS